MKRIPKVYFIGLITLFLLFTLASSISATGVKAGYVTWKATSVTASSSSLLVKTAKSVDHNMIKTSKMYVADLNNRKINVKVTPNKDYKSFIISPKNLLGYTEYRLYIPNAYKEKGKSKSVAVLFTNKKPPAPAPSSKYIKTVQEKYSKFVTNLTIKTTKEVFKTKAIYNGKTYVGHYNGGLSYNLAIAKATKGSKITIYVYDSKNKLIGAKAVTL